MALPQDTIIRASRALERVTVGFACVALVFRATWYWGLPPAPGASYGRGDVIDFALGALLFLLALLTAGSGLTLALSAPRDQVGRAYRPVAVGMTSFVVYYFLSPHLPRLW